MGAVGLARSRSHAIPLWPDQEAHEANYRVANEALAIYFLAKVWHRCSYQVQVSVVLVEPRRQYHNFS